MHVVGCYLAPDDASTIYHVVVSISRQTHGAKLLVVGDFNAELDKPEGTTCMEEIAAVIATAGLKDMITHFLPRGKTWSRDWCTWSMRRRD